MNSAQPTDSPRVPTPTLAMAVLVTMRRRERMERERRQRRRIRQHRTWRKTVLLPVQVAVLGGMLGAGLGRYELLPAMMHQAALSRSTLPWTQIADTAMLTTILGTLLLLFAFLALRTGVGWFAKRWRWRWQGREREQAVLASLPEHPEPS